MLEGREFIIYTDQKPLTYAFKQKPDKCTPRQLRHLDYISQFSTDIRYVVGTENKVADALSRVEIDAIIKPPILDYRKFAQAQLQDSQIQSFLEADSSIKLEKQYFPLEDVSLYCDKSLKTPRPFVPKNLKQVVFQNLHFLSHPGISATTNLISKRFFWPGMRKDIKNRVRACEKCQRAKVFKHTKAPLSTFALPDARFSHIHIDYIGPYPPSKGYKYCLTIIDRYTRWPEVISIEDMLAETTGRALLNGLRSAMKNDLKATSSQLVYGTTLRLPSDLISSESLQTSVTPTYVSKLISMMRKLSPISPDYHSCTKSYVHQSLSMQRPYSST
ncbi:transposon Tf2-6 polyprotein [Trichonephila clavipes]|nr:transposon Tf2-6 polyprotein [Trichonephila clavipes]